MKTKLLAIMILLLCYNNAISQTTAIPDSNFEQALIDLGVDTNGANGNILNSDAEAATVLDLNDKNIANLTGIEAFINLTQLYANNNSLTAINVSSNPLLERLYISNNGTFTNLDISMLPNLKRLFADNLGLTSIDVAANTNLEWLIVRRNALTNIDLSTNVNLQSLYVGENDIELANLTNIPTTIQRISAPVNKIPVFDATPYTNLQLLDLQDMQAGYSLTSVDVTNLASLQFLFVGENALTTVNTSTNTGLLRLGVNNMGSFTTLDISNNLSLQYLYAGESNITGSFDLSNHPDLVFVSFYQNDISSINIANGNNTALTNFYAAENTNLSCVTVDDVQLAYSRNGDADFSWFVDNSIIYATDCSMPATVNVPDDNFEQALIDLGVDRSGVLDDTILLAEALATRFININSRNITDLTGLEHFVNLTGLNASSNPLNTFDTTPFSQLEYLDLYNTNISALDLSNTPNMKALYCAQNNISVLDVSSLNLRELGCDNNNITTLNLANSSDLQRLFATNNQLNAIDVTSTANLQYIYVNDNPIGTLDLSSQTQLIEVGAGGTGISTINVSNSPNLTKLLVYSNQLTNINVSNNTNLIELDCNNNDINADLDLSNHTQLTRVLFEGNELSGLNIQNGNTAAINELDVRNNPLLTCVQVDDINDANTKVDNGQWQKSNSTLFNLDCNNEPRVYVPDDNFEQALIDLGIDTGGVMDDYILLANALGTDFMDLAGRNISNPTGFEAFTNLTGLNLSGNNLSTLPMYALTKLVYLDIYENNFSALDVNSTPDLKELFCANNNISQLDVTNLNLRKLHCGGNSISTLSLNNSTDLIELNANSTNLSSIDLSNNLDLRYCWLSNNNLGGIDVSHLTQLMHLGLGATQITSVDTSNMPNLSILVLYGNTLTQFDISNNLMLTDLNLDGCTQGGVLDLSQHNLLERVFVSGNNFNGINLLNLNNNLLDHNFVNNPNLTCIQVDDVAYANANYTNKDSQTTFNTNCNYPEVILIPDPNFEQALLNDGVDTNGISGDILKSDAEALTILDIRDGNINSLEGISGFINIQTLNISNNNITSLDLSNNPALQHFYASDNQINSLTFAETSLMQTNNGTIATIEVDNNPLSNLDVTGFSNLNTLNISGTNITTINVTNNANLNVLKANNVVTPLINVTQNPNLVELSLENNTALSTLNLTNNSLLQDLNVNNCDLSNLNIANNLSLVYLRASDNAITNLNLDAHNNLAFVDLSNNMLNNFSVKNGNNNNLYNLYINGNADIECVNVDNVTLANNRVSNGDWNKDTATVFSEDCSTLSLQDAALTSEFAIYPNPTTNLLNIKTAATINSVDIISVTGKRIKTVTENTNRIDLSKLQNGVYFITINTPHTAITKRIIKN